MASRCLGVDAARCHIWAFMFIPAHPLRGVISHFIKIAPMVLRQSFMANGSVKALHIGILLRLTWLDVFQADTFGARPVLQCCADVLRPVVTANDLGFATPLHDLLQDPNHT